MSVYDKTKNLWIFYGVLSEYKLTMLKVKLDETKNGVGVRVKIDLEE